MYRTTLTTPVKYGCRVSPSLYRLHEHACILHYFFCWSSTVWACLRKLLLLLGAVNGIVTVKQNDRHNLSCDKLSGSLGEHYWFVRSLFTCPIQLHNFQMYFV